jgi:hypothetical protein
MMLLVALLLDVVDHAPLLLLREAFQHRGVVLHHPFDVGHGVAMPNVAICSTSQKERKLQAGKHAPSLSRAISA